MAFDSVAVRYLCHGLPDAFPQSSLLVPWSISKYFYAGPKIYHTKRNVHYSSCLSKTPLRVLNMLRMALNAAEMRTKTNKTTTTTTKGRVDNNMLLYLTCGAGCGISYQTGFSLEAVHFFRIHLPLSPPSIYPSLTRAHILPPSERFFSHRAFPCCCINQAFCLLPICRPLKKNVLAGYMCPFPILISAQVALQNT